ncbi:hypothetical protein [Fredinandcohnia quinoae]|uniref:Uncharacterized protein n=1 Tax=Fredinandcohnia quinoae TaxID=2918902 RepID=A0AAW5E3Q7_9BACI|nr:hypothetical protein [Fredinandcohnia sp. SECRCQ15]MCH1626998.1 hypothetical protein [Fredinandcohnia sp. SECRCQ15]
MSDYQMFLQERDRLDYLIQKGFRITNITENLSGAFVEFENSASEKETLQIVNPEARKYFAVLLIKQQKEGA